MRWNYYKLRQLSLLQIAMDGYYKLRQLFYYKVRNGYYKLRQVLQSAMNLLQIATGITKCARLAQLGERRSAEREAVGSNPGRTNTPGL